MRNDLNVNNYYLINNYQTETFVHLTSQDLEKLHDGIKTGEKLIFGICQPISFSIIKYFHQQ